MQTLCRLCTQLQCVHPNVHIQIQLGRILSVKQCLRHELILANMLLTSTSMLSRRWLGLPLFELARKSINFLLVATQH